MTRLPQTVVPPASRRALLRLAGWTGLAAWAGSGLLLGGCASAPPPRSSGTTRPLEEATDPGLADVAIHAIGLVGTPYRWGGNTPEGGFDCSGLIAYVYTQAAGLRTPRSVKDLQYWGQAVDAPDVRVGDLVLFGSGAQPTHAGIVVSRQRFVHAPSSGGLVRLDELNAQHWRTQVRGYRRAPAWPPYS